MTAGGCGRPRNCPSIFVTYLLHTLPFAFLFPRILLADLLFSSQNSAPCDIARLITNEWSFIADELMIFIAMFIYYYKYH